MKKKTLFAALFLTLALVGCGEEEPVKTPEVLGTLEPSTQVTEESETETETETETEEPEEEFRIITEREVVDGKMQSYLTGEWKDEEIVKRRNMAVMMPNNKPALPQRGISYASIVYEAPVEGRITRLMAIIEDYDELEYIGPVRSSRDYYIYEAMSLDSIYCNWGLAVPYVADLINSDRIDNVSQAVSGIESSASYAFERVDRGEGYKTEYTGYMTIEGYEKAVDKKGYETEYRDTFVQAFTFADEGFRATYDEYPEATKIWPGGEETNKGGYGDAKPCFTYDEEEGVYYRSQFGKQMVDEIDDRPIYVSNVVFKICEGAVRDKNDYLIFGTHSECGDAYVFTNGKVIKATWKRVYDTDPTVYYDEEGNEIIFNQGKTWVCNIWKDYEDCMKWE